VEIALTLPEEDSKPCTLPEGSTVADLEALFGGDSRVDFWIVNGFPVGIHNHLVDGDRVAGGRNSWFQKSLRPSKMLEQLLAMVDDKPADVAARTNDSAEQKDADVDNREMIRIEAGSFLMGLGKGESPIDQYLAPGFFSDDALPARDVRISQSFEISKTPITQAQYLDIMGENPASHRRATDLPVESVSWHEAIIFCNRLSEREGLDCVYESAGTPEEIEEYGPVEEMDAFDLGELFSDFGVRWKEPGRAPGYRLPTEAEWEYACRAGCHDTRYAADPGDIAWTDDNSDYKTQSVGRLAANDWGLHDMLGNVLEWCWDWYSESYYGSRPDPDLDPTGPEAGSDKVVRGGNFFSAAEIARASFRGEWRPDSGGNGIGFRIARSLAKD